jgi:hypothetical protein
MAPAPKRAPNGKSLDRDTPIMLIVTHANTNFMIGEGLSDFLEKRIRIRNYVYNVTTEHIRT